MKILLGPAHTSDFKSADSLVDQAKTHLNILDYAHFTIERRSIPNRFATFSVSRLNHQQIKSQ